MNATEKLKRELTRKRKPAAPPTEFLSCGCTPLNLACSGRPRGAFAKGHFYWLVGDSTSGKTFLALTCFAEALRSRIFRDYRIIFDQPEIGALMDFERFFGKAVAARVEAPRKDGRPSENIEDFYDNIDDALLAGKPFIYVVDSADALSSESEEDKFQQQKTARRKGKDVTGSMGDGKSKKNSSGLRRLMGKLEKSGSILIMISQTRDNMNPFTAKFNPKIHSGGRALKFYATVELWSSVKGKIKRRIKGKDRQLGIICRVDTKKNRITGRDRTVEFPIYHTVGIDDTEACINYLVAEGHWKAPDGVVNAKEFGIRRTVEDLVKEIETCGQEKLLQNIVAEVWNGIEAACTVERKRRYV